jgi:adenylate kinase family enzyme
VEVLNLYKVLIIIAGMPGAGKTRFANYLSDKLQIP